MYIVYQRTPTTCRPLSLYINLYTTRRLLGKYVLYIKLLDTKYDTTCRLYTSLLTIIGTEFIKTREFFISLILKWKRHLKFELITTYVQEGTG